jgi:hypothetical protein
MLILFSGMVLISCQKDNEWDYSKPASFAGTWNVSSSRILRPVQGGEPTTVESVFWIRFHLDQTGDMTGLIPAEILWVIECDPDILVISRLQGGFVEPLYTNTVFEIRGYQNCCRRVLYRKDIETINQVEYSTETTWVLER